MYPGGWARSAGVAKIALGRASLGRANCGNLHGACQNLRVESAFFRGGLVPSDLGVRNNQTSTPALC